MISELYDLNLNKDLTLRFSEKPSNSTMKSKEMELRMFKKFLKVPEISTDELISMITELSKDKESFQDTLLRYVSLRIHSVSKSFKTKIRSFLNFIVIKAVRYNSPDDFKHNLGMVSKMMKDAEFVEKQRTSPASRRICQSVYTYFFEKRNKEPFVVLAFCYVLGAKQNAVLALTFSDIDSSKLTITLKNKDPIKLPKSFFATFSEYLTIGKGLEESDYVFSINANELSAVMRSAKKRLVITREELNGVNSMTKRRCARDLYKLGMTKQKIKEYLKLTVNCQSVRQTARLDVQDIDGDSDLELKKNVFVIEGIDPYLASWRCFIGLYMFNL
jgi:hypothetical protein